MTRAQQQHAVVRGLKLNTTAESMSRTELMAAAKVLALELSRFRSTFGPLSLVFDGDVESETAIYADAVDLLDAAMDAVRRDEGRA